MVKRTRGTLFSSFIPKYIRLLSHFLLLVFVSGKAIEVYGDAPLDGFDSYVEEKMQKWQVPGLALAVVKDDEIVFAKGYGTRTVGKKEPVDKDTLFAIASMSKYITATSLAMLVAKGVISFDDPIVKYLPNFKVKDPLITQQITIRDVLSHRTGLQRADFAWGTRPSLTRKEILSLLQHLDNEGRFRDSYIYNNLLYMAAGEVIPAVTGDSWDEFVKQRIFLPLRMTRSNTSVDDLAGVDNIATPHALVAGRIVSIPYQRVDNAGSAGAINSSISDMAEWLRMQINGGEFEGERLVPLSLLKDTRRIHNNYQRFRQEGKIRKDLFVDEFQHIGLGIMINKVTADIIYGHGGGLLGTSSFNAFIPSLELGVVVLTNRANGLATPLVGEIIDRYQGVQREVDGVDALMNRRKDELESKAEELLRLKYNRSQREPSMVLDGYTGQYQNDLMGTFIVGIQEGNLVFRWGEVAKGTMVHVSGNTFIKRILEPKGVSDLMGSEAVVEFKRGDGRLAQSILVDGYTFTRADD